MAIAESTPVEFYRAPRYKHGPFRRAMSLAWRKKVGTFGAIIVAFAVFVAIFGPWIAPYSPNDLFERPNPLYDPDSFDSRRINPTQPMALAGPSWDHPLGTDALGRDLMTRVIYGARLSMLIGVVAAGVAAIIGTSVGIASAYLGGWPDMVIQRFVDALIVMPSTVVLLLIVQINQGSLSLTIAALGFLGIASSVRVMRSAALVVRGELYVDSARAVGAGGIRIMMRHILPNIVGIVIVGFTISIGFNILAESGLAFLGLSVTGPSWGRMVNDGRTFLETKPLMSIVGGGAITLTVLGFNLMGDALRDILDPRQRGT